MNRGRIRLVSIERFEQEVRALADLGAVDLDWDRPPRHLLLKIHAGEESWPLIYRLAGRREGKEEREEQMRFTAAREGRPLPGVSARRRRRSWKREKPAYMLERAKLLVTLLDEISANQAPMLERELSIRCLGDSKRFEKSFRKTVTDLLIKYGDREYPLDTMEDPSNAREKQMIVLSEHQIEPNPSYLYLKGNAELTWRDGRRIQIYPDFPVAFLTGGLKEVCHIHVMDDTVLTVENLTAYNRIDEKNCFCLFLSGYHKAGMEKLLREIGEDNPGLTFRHFGDLDPGGIAIFEHLRKKTGLPFEPWHMGTEDLERFRAYGKPLEAFDMEMIQRLSDHPRWEMVVRRMAEEGFKLEQEVIAWFLYGAAD